jgi:hypothetical protein
MPAASTRKVRVKILGQRELAKKIKALGDKIDGREVAKIHILAANAAAAIIRAGAPQGPTGNLKRAIVTGVFRNRPRKRRAAFVLVDRRIARHLHLIEFGTAERKQASGKSVGRVKPNPFFARGRNKSRPVVKAILTAGWKQLFANAGIK